jgi:hypothetical protein
MEHVLLLCALLADDAADAAVFHAGHQAYKYGDNVREECA